MKIFDFFVNQSFKKDSDDRDLFFPWGVLGKGYILEHLETKQRIQKFLRLYYAIVFAIMLIWLVAINPYIASSTLGQNSYASMEVDRAGGYFFAELPFVLLFIIGSFIYLYIGIKPMIKGLPITATKFGWQDAYKQNAKALHPAFLWFGQIAAVLFLLAGLFLIFQRDVLLGALSILFFGLMACMYAYMIFLRNKP